MSPPNPSLRELAQMLLVRSESSLNADPSSVVLLNERLRLLLIRFAGVDGFASLLRRALAMASANMPALRKANVGTEGRIEGLEPTFLHDHLLRQEAAIAVTVQLLDLLVTFIGESLTRRMVHEACHEPSADE